MAYIDDIPKRVRVSVVGGGIHGCGVAHDLASRGWRDVHVIERSKIGSGSSSKSAKIIHGGIEFLPRISDFDQISSGLRERKLLMKLAPDIVRPIEFFVPIVRQFGTNRLVVKASLTAYDFLAGRHLLSRHRLVASAEVEQRAPILDANCLRTTYSFWDSQADDLALVQRVAASARRLGATVSEQTEVLRLDATADGWDVTLQLPDGQRCMISALYVVNCLGPWANSVLERSGTAPIHKGLNNKVVHLLMPDLGPKAGVFLPSLKYKRKLLYLMPWHGMTLIGATDDVYTGDLDVLMVEDEEIESLLEVCNQYLRQPLRRSDPRQFYAGLRWSPIESVKTMSSSAGGHTIGERASGRGLLMTVYGGQLSSYRHVAATVGDRISSHFGEFTASGTEISDNWVSALEVAPPVPVEQRFARYDSHVKA